MTLPTLIVLVPAITTFVLFLLPAARPAAIRWWSVLGTGATLLISILIIAQYDRDAAGWQMAQFAPWVESLGISWNTGVDGVSCLMLLLTASVSFAAALVSFRVTHRVKEFYILLLALITGVFTVFASRDLFFFYFAYELAVIPMYLLVGIWGSTNKEYATMKLTLYLTAGAVAALVGILLMYFESAAFYRANPDALAAFLAENPLFAGATAQSMNLLQIFHAVDAGAFSDGFQMWVFTLLLLGFGSIVSMWPLHTWSPGGYAAAPSAASMLHAGVLKKLGAYGLIRICLPALPQASVVILPVVAALAMMNIIYCGLAAMAQRDVKFAIGYSSVSHMGYVLLGIATLTPIGVNGAVFLMFAHGVMAALGFSLIGWFYDQTHTRMMPDLGGLVKQMPFVGVAFTIMALASAGLPGFANFASEVMVLFGAWQAGAENPVFYLYAILAVWGVVIAATYLLRAVRWTFFGPLNPTWAGKLEDARSVVHRAPFAFLAALLVIFGCYPKFVVDLIGGSIGPIVEALAAIRMAGM